MSISALEKIGFFLVATQVFKVALFCDFVAVLVTLTGLHWSFRAQQELTFTLIIGCTQVETMANVS